MNGQKEKAEIWWGIQNIIPQKNWKKKKEKKEKREREMEETNLLFIGHSANKILEKLSKP